MQFTQMLQMWTYQNVLHTVTCKKNYKNIFRLDSIIESTAGRPEVNTFFWTISTYLSIIFEKLYAKQKFCVFDILCNILWSVVSCLGLYTPTNRLQYRYLVEKKKRAKVYGWPRKKGRPPVCHFTRWMSPERPRSGAVLSRQEMMSGMRQISH